MPQQFLHDFELCTHASQQRRMRVTTMPNSGLCRMTERWQRPELFRSRMIRHSLAPAEDTNADQNMMGAPKTCVAVTFLIGLETSIAKAAGWGADDAHQRKGEDVIITT